MGEKAENTTPSDANAAKNETGEKQWKFSQWFRKMQNDEMNEGAPEDANFITAVEFDDTGNFLATADKSGNVVVLQNDPDQARERNELVHYTFFSEFESHQIEFDYVRSIQIEERINQIKWGPKTNDSLFLLATNDKQIKLWKVTEREPIHFANFNVNQPPNPLVGAPPLPEFNALNLRPQGIITKLKVPTIIKDQLCTVTTLKKLYSPDPHTYNITTLSVAPDKESFLSGDNLKINRWDLYRQERCFNVVDLTPPDLNRLTEIITAVDYHPTQENLFLHASNTGNIRLCDLRLRSLADAPSKIFPSVNREQRAAAGMVNFATGDGDAMMPSLYDDLTCGVSAAKFSKGGRFLISRDYMSVKIWDMNYEKKPVETIYVHEYLRERLMELQTSDLLWDTFGVGVSSKGDIVTGSYSNYFHLFELGSKKDVFVQASKTPAAQSTTALSLHNKKRSVNYTPQGLNSSSMKKKSGFKLSKIFGGNKKKTLTNSQPSAQPDEYPHKIPFENIEFNKKILECDWHPEANAVAIAGQNNLFVYSK